MSNIKVLVAGMLTVSSLGLATVSYAETICIDGSVELGTCMHVEEKTLGREDNGWGNGDDAAPGGSAGNNNAENYASTPLNRNPNGFNTTDGDGRSAPGKSNRNGNQDSPES